MLDIESRMIIIQKRIPLSSIGLYVFCRQCISCNCTHAKKPFYTAEISVFQGTIYQETDNSIASSEKAKKGRGGDQAEEHSGTIIVLLYQ